MLRKLMSVIALGILFSTQPLLAFTPGYIITDAEMFDYTSMDQYDIYSFLKRKRSYLATYRPSGAQFASYYIYDAAQRYQINPKVLLTILQKEQSLIENSHPTQYQLDWALGYGMCDSCSRNTPGISVFQGFEQQIYSAAKRIREYYDNPYAFNFRKGNLYQIDNSDVMILNQSTAALYNYTPHLHGNQNFWRIWQRWFIKNIPNNSLVRLPDDPTIWLISYGQRRPIKSMSVLVSRYDPSQIITVSPTDLDKYEEGPAIKFYKYALLEDEDGGTYLLSDDDTVRPIASDEVFRKLGYNHEEVIRVSWEDLHDYFIGEPITLLSAYPTGALLQDNDSQAIYYVRDGIRRPLLARELLKTHFSNVPFLSVTSSELEQLKLGDPIVFLDGQLVKALGDPRVYVIDEGVRRPITSEKVFLGMGYRWDHIIEAKAELIDLHPLGSEIDENYLNSYNLSSK